MKLSMPPFDRARVLVLGDIMLDRYWEGPTSRISPEAPVPVVRVERITDRPGGAGNVALNVTALGAAAELGGYTGEDEMADSLQDMLGGAGVSCRFTRVAGRPTATKLRVISRQQQLIRLDFEDTAPAAAGPGLADSHGASLADFGAVVLSDYAKGALADPQPLIAAARAAGVPVLVDPKSADFARYRGASLLTPNLQELEAVVGSCSGEAELVARGGALMAELELGALLVTRGERGMTLLQPGQQELHLPARAREVYDVTGAGDTVIAVLGAALAAGATLPVAVALSNIAASIVVGKLGTATVSAPELRRAVLAESGSERGVMTREQLEIAVADARAHGERVVFTNGCFDIIHAGHVGYLEQAGAGGPAGGRCQRRFGAAAEGRRAPDQSRTAHGGVVGLEAVDWVVPSRKTPRRCCGPRPDVLVKGGDYTLEGWSAGKSYGTTAARCGYWISSTRVDQRHCQQDPAEPGDEGAARRIHIAARWASRWCRRSQRWCRGGQRELHAPPADPVPPGGGRWPGASSPGGPAQSGTGIEHGQRLAFEVVGRMITSQRGPPPAPPMVFIDTRTPGSALALERLQRRQRAPVR